MRSDWAGGPFGRYLASLVGSWQALAVPSPGAEVVVAAGFVAAKFPAQPLLDNAVLLDASTLRTVERGYADATSYAIWVHDEDPALTGALARAGYHRAETTTPMIIDLVEVELGPPDQAVPADPAAVAMINGLPSELLTGVPNLSAYTTPSGKAGLVLIGVDDDVNVSLVATQPHARRQGLGTSLTRGALAAARADGYRSASLQATPMALRVYTTIGFRPLGRWQEWTRSRHPVPQ